MPKIKTHFVFLYLLVITSTFSCRESISQKNTTPAKKYLTERVIVLVVDGPRYSETWGDPTHQYIPHMAKDMAPRGVIGTNFHNDGYTYTTSGHTALCTGYREELENSKGSDLPNYPSILQHYLKQSGLPKSKAWLVTSKDKLFILGNCIDPSWTNKYNPSSDCGNNGALSGYRDDTITYNHIVKVLNSDKPNLLVVNFKEPDASGHLNNWQGYLNGIVETDSLVWEVWKFIQNDPYYKDKTTLFVTNDHGRHLDGWKDGFISHGDECDGCRHINFYAFGPDFRSNFIFDTYYTQVDLPATVAELMGFSLTNGQGKVMKKLFK